MSQNKTVIPESEYDLHQPSNSDQSPSSEFYRPSGTTPNNTVISGVVGSTTPPPVHISGAISNTQTLNHTQLRSIPLQERVIIGVLFSISKGLLGEVFPIYLGNNLLGSSSNSDICLKERTVSEEHAVLRARSEGYPGNCYVSITDYGSSHGTAVNQKDCRYETLPLNDGDVLTIGSHYRLIVKLFDITESGLFEDSGFEEIGFETLSDPIKNQSTNDYYSPSRFAGKDNRTVIG